MLNILKPGRAIFLLALYVCFFTNITHAESDEIAMTLSGIDFFSGFQQSELELLAGIADLRPAGDGEYLFTQGIMSDSLYILIEGRASVFSHGQFIVSLEAPQVLGEVELVDRRKASADVVISGNSRVIGFKYDELLKVLNNNCELGFKFMKKIAAVLSERLLNMNP